MKVLFSNLAPVRIRHPEATFINVFQRLISDADKLEIAVGYVSLESLEELRALVKAHNIRSVKLILGMYERDGITERTLKLARAINAEWTNAGIGEVLVVKPFAFHGKTYAFYQKERITAVIIGSANLSAIKPDSQTLRQYEVSVESEDPDVCADTAELFQKLLKFSVNLEQANLRTVFDVNLALEGDENASRVPLSDFTIFQKHVTGTEFLLPLKAPRESQKFADNERCFTKSNINVCYAAPRNKNAAKPKPRSWYEIQFTVPIEVRELPGYPQKNHPFFVATDDGYLFKVHTTSDNNKQFNAKNDELTLGRWLKGRFVSAGFVKPVPDTSADVNRDGMITQEMLDQYGCHSLSLQKTTHQILDPCPLKGESNGPFDLWILRFKPDSELK